MENNLLFIILGSGLSGAIAGGVVTLSSQYLNRKWKMKDDFRLEKINLYSKVLSLGSRFMEKENIKEAEKNAATILLFCNDNVKKSLNAYMANIFELSELNIKKSLQGEELPLEVIKENRRLHTELISSIRRELKIKI